jgi:ubiquitin-protein ligase
MATIIQKKRFAGEVKILNKEPLHYATAYPDEEDPLTWYFLIEGQKDTEYEGGRYLGKIVHSPSYPVSPPDYYMFTPSGRYDINKKICLTNSSYHKGDWSSTWNIKTILIAYYSIWLDDSEHGISHIKKTKEERLQMAKESHDFNEKNYKKILDGFNMEHIKIL